MSAWYDLPPCTHGDSLFQDEDGTWCDECGALIDADPTPPHGTTRPDL